MKSKSTTSPNNITFINLQGILKLSRIQKNIKNYQQNILNTANVKGNSCFAIIHTHSDLSRFLSYGLPHVRFIIKTVRMSLFYSSHIPYTFGIETFGINE